MGINMNEEGIVSHYKELKFEIQNIVDMPDRYINDMIRILYLNEGIFPVNERKLFNKLTDDEILRMEKKFNEIFKKG